MRDMLKQFKRRGSTLVIFRTGLLWMDKILHHFETMVETIFLGIYMGINSFPGFLGGANWISSHMGLEENPPKAPSQAPRIRERLAGGVLRPSALDFPVEEPRNRRRVVLEPSIVHPLLKTYEALSKRRRSLFTPRAMTNQENPSNIRL